MKSDSPRVVCVGANLESEIALRGLLAIGANIVGLVTVPPRESASGISDYRSEPILPNQMSSFPNPSPSNPSPSHP